MSVAARGRDQFRQTAWRRTSDARRTSLATAAGFAKASALWPRVLPRIRKLQDSARGRRVRRLPAPRVEAVVGQGAGGDRGADRARLVPGLAADRLRDLPSVDALKTYEPPLPSNVRDTNGMPVYSYARERRVQLSFDEYPKMLVARLSVGRGQDLLLAPRRRLSRHRLGADATIRSAASARAAPRRSRNRSPRTCWSATSTAIRAS